MTDICLNPCYNGSITLTVTLNFGTMEAVTVLILVLMEVSL